MEGEKPLTLEQINQVIWEISKAVNEAETQLERTNKK